MSKPLAQSSNPTLAQYSASRVRWQTWERLAEAGGGDEARPFFLVVTMAHWRRCEILMSEYFEDLELADAINQGYIPILADANESTALVKLALLWHRLARPGEPLLLPWCASLSSRLAPWELYSCSPGQSGQTELASLLIEHAGLLSSKPELDKGGNVLYQSHFGLDQAPAASMELTTEALTEVCESLLDVCAHGAKASGEPRYPLQESLLRMTYALYHSQELSVRCLECAADAAYAMISGGLRDHIGGGFFTRCEEGDWRQPVYLKRLDDNAQMLSLLLHLYAITHQADFYDGAKAQIEFILGQMATGDGTYVYSLQESLPDAVGSHYRYSAAELRKLLPEEYYTLFAQMYGFEPLPPLEEDDFEDAADAQSAARTHDGAQAVAHGAEDDERPMALIDHCRLDELARRHGISLQRCKSILDRCLDTLRSNSRKHRGALSAEGKTLTRANALLVSALVEAGWLMSDSIYHHDAEQLLNHLVERLWVDDIVYAGHNPSEAAGGAGERVRPKLLAPGSLDDYTFLLRALLDFLAVGVRRPVLQRAHELARLIVKVFHDEERGELVYQDPRCLGGLLPLRDVVDGERPGSVPTALECLRRLAWLTGDKSLAQLAQRLSQGYVAPTLENPLEYASMLKNLSYELNPAIVLWFLYDEDNPILRRADLVPVFAGRTQYCRLNYADLKEVSASYDYALYRRMLDLPRRDLQIIATREDEVLEVIDKQPDIYSLERQIKRVNQVRL